MTEARNFNITTKKPLILLAPLDWGFGHTTRCIPIIRELQSLGCQVVVACNSNQKAVLEAEFPQITFLFLKGYDIFYGTNRAMTWLGLLFQIPKILIRIKKEHKWLKTIAQQVPIKAIISDNRYGCYTSGLPSIIITHQLLIRTGAGSRWDRWLQRLHYQLISKFTECWVPDEEGPMNAAGELSHPVLKPSISLQYLGCLSRLNPCEGSRYKYDLLILLSGPEPQRSILEKMIIKELPDVKERVVLVRGIPSQQQQLQFPAHVTVHDYLSATALNELICASALVISRAGYSSIMDLLKLGKKMVLIPTPGQTEQEYLAEYLHGKGIAFTAKQEEFSLVRVIEEVKKFDFRESKWEMEGYKEVLKRFMKKVTG